MGARVHGPAAAMSPEKGKHGRVVKQWPGWWCRHRVLPANQPSWFTRLARHQSDLSHFRFSTGCGPWQHRQRITWVWRCEAIALLAGGLIYDVKRKMNICSKLFSVCLAQEFFLVNYQPAYFMWNLRAKPFIVCRFLCMFLCLLFLLIQKAAQLPPLKKQVSWTIFSALVTSDYSSIIRRVD